MSYPDIVDWSKVHHLTYATRAEFESACERYRNDPRVIDIGYSDMCILIDAEAANQADAPELLAAEQKAEADSPHQPVKNANDSAVSRVEEG